MKPVRIRKNTSQTGFVYSYLHDPLFLTVGGLEMRQTKPNHVTA